jgi:1,2-diacylglycerol 3-alpha-glucosyltransferase
LLSPRIDFSGIILYLSAYSIMRIGIFTDCYLPQVNGVVTSIEIFRKELIKQGHTVFVFGPQSPVKLTRDERHKERENHIFRFFSMTYLRQPEFSFVFPISHKMRNFRKFKLDILHSQDYFPMGMYALYLSWRYKIPHVNTYHTLWAEYAHYSFLPRGISRKALIIWSRIFCNLCRLIISPSPQIKDVLIAYGIKKEVFVLPTGIEIGGWKRDNREEVRKRNGIPMDRRILVFTGRLGKEKNIPFLFRSLQAALRLNSAMQLVMIGGGPEREEMEQYVDTLGIRDHVLFLGYKKRDEVFQILGASDLFVFASKTETQGLVLLEALSVGIPAVVVDAMGVADVLHGEKGGFLVPEDEEIFAGKVSELLDNTELYRQKSIEADQTAKRFSSASMTEQLVKQYKKLLKDPS